MNDQPAPHSPEELEAKVIEQDHRFFKVLWTFFIDRPKWDKEDPRRSASVKALLWLLAAPGTIAATGGGIIAIATLFILVSQNTEIAKQTKLFGDQNELYKAQNEDLKDQIQSQKDQYRINRRTELLTFLYDGTHNGRNCDCLEGQSRKLMTPNYNGRIRSDAFAELYSLEKQYTDFIDLENVIMSSTQFRSKEFTHLNLRCANFIETRLFNVEFNQECLLTWINFESSYLEDCDFEEADLRWANFRNSIINVCRFKSISAHRMDFRNAKVSNSDFSGLDLYGSKFDGATLTNVDFSGSILQGATFVGTTFRNCIFDNATGAPQ